MRKLLALLLAVVYAALPAVAQFERDPVSKTPLSIEGKSLQSGIVAPIGGLASNLADTTRASTQAKVLNNLQMSRKRGIWTSRGIGWQKQRANAFNSGATILDFAVFVDGSGNQTLCFQAGSVLYSYNLGTSTETAIKSGLSATHYPTMRAYSPSTSTTQPILVYCNGNIEPRKVTSTSAESALGFDDGDGGTVWPGSFNSKTYGKPKYCENFGDRMAYAGFDANSTSFDVLISNQGNAEKFTVGDTPTATDAVAFTVPAILGPIRGLRSFKLSNETNEEVLVIGCASGMAVITGSNSSEYGLRILTRSHGILSNRCWVQIDNDVYYLATDGIRTFSSLAANSNLLNSSLTYLIQDKINLIDSSSAAVAHATHNPATFEVQWWVPLRGDSGQCKHAFIMNYNTERGPPEPVWSTKDGFAAASSINFNGQFYHGTYDGFLCTDYNGDTYGGTAIVFDYVSPLINVGNPAQAQSMRKLIVLADGQVQKFVIKPYVYSRVVSGETVRQSGTPSSAVLTSGVAGGTVLGSWTLGTSPFPTDHVKTIDFQPSGNGIFWECEITASATDHLIDFAGLAYILSGGGLQR
jgi:hypothetical protein